MAKNQDQVVSYYRNLESRLGYTFLTWDTKHFGYYPSKKRDIPEKKAQELMTDLLAGKLELEETDRALDAGCGRGTVACHLAQKYKAKIIGIDIVPFELKKAKARALKMNLTNKVKFFLRDYSDTKFPDNYFDKIFTLETLVHSPDLEKTLSEFYRILKPEGKLALFEYSKSHPSKFSGWERKMLDIINKGSAMAGLEKLSHDDFAGYIKNEGFSITTNEEITKYMLPSLERFNKYAQIPYKLIKFLNLQRHFINTTSGVEFYKMMRKGLVKYRTIVARKPL